MVGCAAFGQRTCIRMLYEICFAKEAKKWLKAVEENP